MKAYEIQNFGIENLKLVERERPEPNATEALVRFHAASLNYRDLMMVKGEYNPKLEMPLVPLSDGAGEVVEIGSEVSKWNVGDRVMPSLLQGWHTGEISHKKARTALGGDIDGCLREFGAFDEEGLVKIPEHLSYEEASTLPCAAVTAWNALMVSGKLKSGESVLLLGTGGVSIFALQFAKNIGAKAIITSSSDEKLDKAQALGANHLINYKTEPEWDRSVSALTEKKGVDHVIEVGGIGTLQKSVNAVRMGGHIAVIGILTADGEFNPVSILMKAVKLQGIYVGSCEMFEQMNDFIGKHDINPVVDRVFEFGEAREALKFMESGGHFGKIVVKI